MHCRGTFSLHPRGVFLRRPFLSSPHHRVRFYFVFRRCGARDSIKLLTRPPPGRGSRTDGNSYLPPGKLNVVVSLLPGLLHVRYASHRAEVPAMPPLRFRIGISGFQRFSNDARYCAFSFFFSSMMRGTDINVGFRYSVPAGMEIYSSE